MQAIQELMVAQQAVEDPSDVKQLLDDLAEAHREREELKQRVHDLDNQVKLMEDEKANLLAEMEALHQKKPNASLHHVEESSVMQQELRRQVEVVQEELYKSESQKEELQIKVELMEKQVEEAQAKEVELQVRNADLVFTAVSVLIGK